MPEHVRTKNRLELQCCEELEAQGYTVVKRGWPDFLAWKDDEVRFIEVKPKGYKLKACQRTVADVLAKVGAQVEVWSPQEPGRG